MHFEGFTLVGYEVTIKITFIISVLKFFNVNNITVKEKLLHKLNIKTGLHPCKSKAYARK